LLIKHIRTHIYRTEVLPRVLYGREVWSLTLRKKHKLKVFENRMLRNIFGPYRDEVRREWRRVHNEEFYALYASPNIIGVIKSRKKTWAGHVARLWYKRGSYRVLVGRPDSKRPLGKRKRRWDDIIKLDLQDVGWGGMDWIAVAQDGQVADAREFGNEFSGSAKCGKFIEQL
jgi:hypothetical protein